MFLAKWTAFPRIGSSAAEMADEANSVKEVEEEQRNHDQAGNEADVEDDDDADDECVLTSVFELNSRLVSEY